MSIGKMRHRIILQSVTAVINDNGFETKQPQVFATVWADVSNLHGREFYQAQAVQAENTVKFTIRYLPGIDASMHILFQGKTYNITSIDNIKYRNRYLEIKALEVESSG